jgi:hypothetical protein
VAAAVMDLTIVSNALEPLTLGACDCGMNTSIR